MPNCETRMNASASMPAVATSSLSGTLRTWNIHPNTASFSVPVGYGSGGGRCVCGGGGGRAGGAVGGGGGGRAGGAVGGGGERRRASSAVRDPAQKVHLFEKKKSSRRADDDWTGSHQVAEPSSPEEYRRDRADLPEQQQQERGEHGEDAERYQDRRVAHVEVEALADVLAHDGAARRRRRRRRRWRAAHGRGGRRRRRRRLPRVCLRPPAPSAASLRVAARATLVPARGRTTPRSRRRCFKTSEAAAAGELRTNSTCFLLCIIRLYRSFTRFEPRSVRSNRAKSVAVSASTRERPGDFDARAHRPRTDATMPPKAAAEDETAPVEVKGIKMSEVEKHSSADDLWLVIDGAPRGRPIARPPPFLKRDVSRFDRSLPSRVVLRAMRFSRRIAPADALLLLPTFATTATTPSQARCTT